MRGFVRRQLERAAVIGLSRQRVELPRSIARENEVTGQAAFDIGPRVSRRAREVERLAVVVNEDLGVVGDAFAGSLLDPAGSSNMLVCSRGTWDLLVSDVAHERVPEGELVLAVDRRDADGADELAVDELVQLTPRDTTIAFADCRDRAAPEDSPDDGSIVQERFLLRTKRVEPRCDQRLHGLRYGEALDVAALLEHARELLGVQRVASRSLEEHALRLGRQERAVEQEMQEARRDSSARERRERDRRRVAFAAAPAGCRS